MATQVSNKKILIIDDDPNILFVIRTRLEASGYTVVTASDGGEGLLKTLSERPALILLDIRMPGIDGWTFIGNLHRSAVGKSIPVIVATAQGKLKDLFGTEGIADYIVKPYTADELLKRIRSCIEENREQ